MPRSTNSANVLYKLEIFADDPKFEGFAFVDDETFDFMPKDIPTKGRNWTVPRLASQWTPQKVEGRVRPSNDYPCVDMTIPAFSRKAVDALKDMLEANGELLRLESKIGEYYAYNVTTVADVLDRDLSKIKWYSGGSVVANEIKKYVCNSERLKDLSIFRIIEKPSSTFVTQTFVDRVLQCNLQGFNFTKLWTEPGSKPRSTHGDRESDASPVADSTRNTVVILLPLQKNKPNSREKLQIDKIMDELDNILYNQSIDASETYFGSLEGNDTHNGMARLFISCPSADLLVEKLRTWIASLKWRDSISVLKRYGHYQDTKCREEQVTI